MNAPNRSAHKIAENPWVVIIFGFASLASFVWFLYDKLSANPSVLSTLIFVGVLIIFLGAFLYSFHIRQEISALRDMAKHIHRINHNYRDILKSTFSEQPTESNKLDIVGIEENTIKSVCQRIEKIFSRLIRKDCLVTVKLITKEADESRYCTTYARSEMQCERDDNGPFKFKIGAGDNLAFDTALCSNPEGISRFFSSDLMKDLKRRKYTNQRQHFDRFYKSAIVVPIRYLCDKPTRHSDDIGFLSVDTFSRNRFNDDFHVELLASFADQMYNFFCLLRGKYKIGYSDKKHNERG